MPNARGVCWPGIKRLTRKCGVDERTVQRHLRALERKRILRTITRSGGNPATNFYILPVIHTPKTE